MEEWRRGARALRRRQGDGHREGGIGTFDFSTEWKPVYIDYSDKLQKARIDRAE